MHSVDTISNNKIKEIIKLHQKKYRDELKMFIAEGEKVLEEAINSNIEIIDIYALETYKPKIKNIKVKTITDSQMKKISTTSSVCEVLVIGKQKPYTPEPYKYKKIILLDSISDPGNLGTIIRSAAAFNIDCIILFGNSIELYSPKVIRSSAGNFFKTPIINIRTEKELNELFKDYTFISTDLRNENNITLEDAKNIEKKIIMLGSESKGLSRELISKADKNIKLKMNKDVESLNLSVSASIIMYGLF